MAKTKKELTNILNALTGETHAEHEFKSKAEIIGEISKHTSGGGGGGGGGAEKFVVTLTKEDDTWTADKSIADICTAADANKVVVAQYEVDGANVELPMNGWQTPSVAVISGIDGEGEIVFVGANDGNADVWEQTKVEFIDKYGFPAEDSANANKFLGFDANGDYTALDNPIFKVNYILTEDLQTPGKFTATTETEYADILGAMNAGKAVCASITGDLKATIGNSFYTPDSGGSIGFDSGFGVTIIHSNDGTITVATSP